MFIKSLYQNEIYHKINLNSKVHWKILNHRYFDTVNETNDFQFLPRAMKFRLEFRFIYFQTSGSTIDSQLDGLVVSRITVQLFCGYLWVALGSKVLNLLFYL